MWAVFQVLGLASTQVGDTVVRRGLIHCSELVKINLSRTRITDHGELSALGYLTSQMSVRQSAITPLTLTSLPFFSAGLKFLRQTQLSQVNLDSSGVTLVGVANLISSCPLLTSVRASHTRVIPLDQVSDDDDDDVNRNGGAVN